VCTARFWNNIHELARQKIGLSFEICPVIIQNQTGKQESLMANGHKIRRNFRSLVKVQVNMLEIQQLFEQMYNDKRNKEKVKN
jgi:hypothetical protein